jgi:cobalamin-dependent methionine synthase I
LSATAFIASIVAVPQSHVIPSGALAIESIRLIKEKIPYVETVLGISNISFGLSAAAREVVNPVFRYYCTKAGLDLTIVNAEKLERFASIPERERRFAEALLFNTPPENVPVDHPNVALLGVPASHHSLQGTSRKVRNTEANNRPRRRWPSTGITSRYFGENLVEIILSNNRYNVVNLGIKVPPEEFIKTYLW